DPQAAAVSMQEAMPSAASPVSPVGSAAVPPAPAAPPLPEVELPDFQVERVRPTMKKAKRQPSRALRGWSIALTIAAAAFGIWQLIDLRSSNTKTPPIANVNSPPKIDPEVDPPDQVPESDGSSEPTPDETPETPEVQTPANDHPGDVPTDTVEKLLAQARGELATRKLQAAEQSLTAAVPLASPEEKVEVERLTAQLHCLERFWMYAMRSAERLRVGDELEMNRQKLTVTAIEPEEAVELKTSTGATTRMSLKFEEIEPQLAVALGQPSIRGPDGTME